MRGTSLVSSFALYLPSDVVSLAIPESLRRALLDDFELASLSLLADDVLRPAESHAVVGVERAGTVAQHGVVVLHCERVNWQVNLGKQGRKPRIT